MIEDMRVLGVVFITENSGGKITVQSIGNKPSKTYTIQATIVEIEPEIEPDKILGIPVGAAKSVEDPVSPIITVNKENNTTILTIEDIEGTKTAIIPDGEDGSSGVHVGSEIPPEDATVWVYPSGEADLVIKSVNNILPDENGNINIEIPTIQDIINSLPIWKGGEY
jgi:hypothetical protein